MAILPEAQDKEWMPKSAWLMRHESFVQRTKSQLDTQVVFLGDSITEGWTGAGKPPWVTEFERPFNCLNLGIGGDEVQHVHWRIINGEGDGTNPAVVSILAGTNNIGNAGHDPADVIVAIGKLADAAAEKWPNAKILMHTIFPRDEKPSGQREKIEVINKQIRDWGNAGRFELLDMYEIFLEEDGTLPKTLMPDFLHLSEKAYVIWASKLKVKLDELMA
ncbi:MAG: GDSL family lipase [Lentisphaeria bacterium]|nr:GDSL-type esterase/lipase family protein [Lentisphaeria bacterium]NQZ69400.1 GDSL family lipase [Lentisphaeria bacterium]